MSHADADTLRWFDAGRRITADIDAILDRPPFRLIQLYADGDGKLRRIRTSQSDMGGAA